MILPCQIAFIKTRDITDGIVYLHEILYECKRRKWQGVILKLDFEKAYDKVNWAYLFECLTKCGWMKTLVIDGTLSVKINNNLGYYFETHRGVGQGDPISPQLFNLVGDSLARLFRKMQEINLIVSWCHILSLRGCNFMQTIQSSCFSMICMKA
jgi:hypothetical protein